MKNENFGNNISKILSTEEGSRAMLSMVQYQNLRMMYTCAIKEIQTKFEVLNTEFNLRHKHNPISFITSRLKQTESIIGKLKKHDIPITVENIEEYVNDVAGIWVVCSYIDDIYKLANALLGESRFSMEIINQSITLQKAKLEKLEKEIPEVLAQVNEEKGALQSLDHYYEQFAGWAEEYDLASKEEQKMIICQLMQRITIGRQYKIGIELNMNYGQFIDRRPTSEHFTMHIDTLGRARGC